MYINCFYIFDLHVHCCIATSPTSMFFAAVYHSFSVKAIRLPCPYIYWLFLTVRGLLQDWSYYGIYDVRWHYCQLFSLLTMRQLGHFLCDKLEMCFSFFSNSHQHGNTFSFYNKETDRLTRTGTMAMAAKYGGSFLLLLDISLFYTLIPFMLQLK